MTKTKLQIAIETLMILYDILPRYDKDGYTYYPKALAKNALEGIELAPEVLSVDQQVENIVEFSKKSNKK